MTDDNLENMAGMLGDPEVIAFYPRPKSVEEALAWITWNTVNYEEYGYGLWIIETKSGQFVGDCGLTWQAVNDRPWPCPRLVDTGLSDEVKIRGLG